MSTIARFRRLNLFRRKYHTQEHGALYSDNYRMYFKSEKGEFISPFHDIPLIANNTEKTYHMVVEIPRWSSAKMEIDTKHALNPIKQDIQNGKPRFTPNIFPYNGYIWNYGAFPQTWENPEHRDSVTNCTGDNDPIDVCEIGSKVLERGQIVIVKVLGVLGMIDQGEMDWKVVVLNKEDELYDKIHNLNDVEKYKPGYLGATREWFRSYKIPSNKPENTFSFEEAYQNERFSESLLQDAHKFWNKLVKNDCHHKLDITNTTQSTTQQFISQERAVEIVNKNPPMQVSAKINTDTTWHFIH